jgi:Family of unknown function (DUF6328)
MMNQETERLKLTDAARYVFEECRMVLPGIQALFGFQMISVFNQGFAQKLDPFQQKLHGIAIVFVVAAIGLIMAPAAPGGKGGRPPHARVPRSPSG